MMNSKHHPSLKKHFSQHRYERLSWLLELPDEHGVYLSDRFKFKTLPFVLRHIVLPKNINIFGGNTAGIVFSDVIGGLHDILVVEENKIGYYSELHEEEQDVDFPLTVNVLKHVARRLRLRFRL
jgi:hypothetical protein